MERSEQAKSFAKIKKVFQEAPKTKFVFLSGRFGLAFRDYVSTGNYADEERLFTIDQAAKLLGLEKDCVYVSSSKNDMVENSHVFFLYYSQKYDQWVRSDYDEMDIDYDKVDGYGTFEQLANKLNKHVHESNI